MLCVRNFFVVSVISEEMFEQMVQGKTDLKDQKRESLRLSTSRNKSIKKDRVSINENDDDGMAFNDP